MLTPSLPNCEDAAEDVRETAPLLEGMVRELEVSGLRLTRLGWAWRAARV